MPDNNLPEQLVETLNTALQQDPNVGDLDELVRDSDRVIVGLTYAGVPISLCVNVTP